MPHEPPASSDSGKTRSALRDRLPVVSLGEFRSRLDTVQIESELDAIFRESPEFGRNLAARLASFVEEPAAGPLRLIAAGGEVAVLFDSDSQQVLKLCGPPARCGFGWIVRRAAGGILTLVPGGLDEILDRLALFEALFSSGISLDCCGENDGFLVFRQPFIVGQHPTEEQLHQHMRDHGWQPHAEPCIGDTLEKLTWSQGRFLATDVRPENALIAEATGNVHPIDFIVV